MNGDTWVWIAAIIFLWFAIRSMPNHPLNKMLDKIQEKGRELWTDLWK